MQSSLFTQILLSPLQDKVNSSSIISSCFKFGWENSIKSDTSVFWDTEPEYKLDGLI